MMEDKLTMVLKIEFDTESGISEFEVYKHNLALGENGKSTFIELPVTGKRETDKIIIKIQRDPVITIQMNENMFKKFCKVMDDLKGEKQ
jgi:hypothetical protein